MRDRAAVSLIILLVSFASGCCLCPRVYRVGEPSPPAGQSPPPPSFGVLFVPSGFPRRDLPAFWVATEELARSVLAEGPFGSASLPGDPEIPTGDREIRVEFFRIDLVGRHPRQDSSGDKWNQWLRRPAPSPGAPPGTPLDSSRRRASSLPLDLGVEQVKCDELSIGVVGEAAALSLAQCVPGVDVVVIVVNLDCALGFTRQLAGAGDIGLAVVGVDLTDTPDVGGDFVSIAAVDTLRHELGHVLGLLDEYYCNPTTDRVCAEKDWPTDAQFRHGRNVWREETILKCEEGLNGREDLKAIPWKFCDPPSQCCCKVLVEQVVLTPSCDHSQYQDQCGLWEGAYYRSQGYFRSHQRCVMEECDNPFCPVCFGLLEAALRKHSTQSTATGQ